MPFEALLLYFQIRELVLQYIWLVKAEVIFQ